MESPRKPHIQACLSVYVQKQYWHMNRTKLEFNKGLQFKSF